MFAQDFWQRTNGPYGDYITGLAINSSGHIFAGTGTGSGVFRSTDNGDNWTAKNTGFTNPLITVTSLAINASGHIFSVNDWEIFKSMDNGESWARVYSSSTTVVCLGINSSGHIFAGTDAGIVRSTDNGNNWTPAGLMNTTVLSLAINSNLQITVIHGRH